MDQNRIWDYFQNEAPEIFQGSLNRLKFLLDHLKTHSRVLNIGVGSGLFEELALANGHDVYSVDPIEPSVIAVRERLKLGEKAKVGYGQALPFPSDYFDAIVISEVVEHLSPEITDATLKEILRVLVNGGVIIGTVPARENLQDNMVVCPHCGEVFHRWGHQQTFDSEKMCALLVRYFRVDKIMERPFVTWQQYNWRGKFVHFARMTLWYLGSHSSNEHVYFHATKL
jgi:SAM-dependent methyltransferase